MVLFRIVSEPAVLPLLDCSLTSLLCWFTYHLRSMCFSLVALFLVKVGYHLLVTREWFEATGFPFQKWGNSWSYESSSKHGNGTYLFTLWL